MEIITNENTKVQDRTVVALGNFDGIHIGHMELFKKCKQRARDIGARFAVLTFDSKLTKLKSKRKNCSLISHSQKIDMFRDMDVDILYLIEFSDKIKNTSHRDFIENIVIDKLNAEEIFVGFNYTFGKNAEGNVEYLKSGDFPFKINVIEPVRVDGKIVSSTLIRECLGEGKIRLVNRMLVKPFTIRGKVVRGKGRGKGLGFPTLNLHCEIDYLPPKYGVYETRTLHDGKSYKSITNVGKNPTFGDVTSFSIETHLLEGFDSDIYEDSVDITFIDFLREEIKFSSVESLVEQVKSDICTLGCR